MEIKVNQQFYTYCLHCKLVPLNANEIDSYKYRGDLVNIPCSKCDGEAILYSNIDDVFKQITLDDLFRLTNGFN